MGGAWKKYDDSGNLIGEVVEEKLVTKYGNSENCWIFECWCPPENYGSAIDWDTNFTKLIEGKWIKTLGPYPHNGEYELLKALVTPKGFAVPLTGTIVEALVAVAKQNRDLPKRIRMEAFRDAQKKEEKAKEQRQIAIIENLARPSWAKDDSYIILPHNISDKGTVIQ